MAEVIRVINLQWHNIGHLYFNKYERLAYLEKNEIHAI